MLDKHNVETCSLLVKENRGNLPKFTFAIENHGYLTFRGSFSIELVVCFLKNIYVWI